MLNLRRFCLSASRRQRCLATFTRNTDMNHHLVAFQPKRHYGLSRHPDPLAPRVDLNTVETDEDEDDKKQVYTADDLEYEEVIQNWSESNDIQLFPPDNDDEPIPFGKKKRPLTPLELRFQEKQGAIQEELNSRRGRLWEDRWIISDEEWMSTDVWDDIEEWSEKMVTRVALESVRIWDAGVPTLQQLSTLPLPPSPSPHPGHGSPSIHATSRKRHLNKRLRTAIQLSISQDLTNILSMTSWEEKQEAVDGLFEVIEERVRAKEPILGQLPDFKERVEDGLEQVLRMVHSRVRGIKKGVAAGHTAKDADGKASPSSGGELAKDDIENAIDVMGVKKERAVPVFMDLLKFAKQQGQSTSSHDSTDDESLAKRTLPDFFTKSNEAGVPNLVYPLNVHYNEGIGRMVEEWQLAANKETKRIMMRDGMKEIAGKIVEAANCCGGEVGDEKKGATRILVTGKRGVGKTAALAGLVASARVSGHIVVYLPDGDRLRKHGFYIEPCSYRTGLYNLPEIAKEFCEQLLTSHGDDLKEMSVSKDVMTEYLSEELITRLFARASDDDANQKEDGASSATLSSDELSLDKVLDVGMSSTSLSSGCYCVVLAALMSQKKKPFSVVMDEFNCYYDHGHYFHMDYDENVRKAIPVNKITIFKPFLDAMGLYPAVVGNEIIPDNEITPDNSAANSTSMMKWGSMIVGTSESRAVRQAFTQALTDSAHAQSQTGNSFHVVDLQRFSDVEVQHVLYNFECTGIGRLRFDRGYTTLNPEEVEYLRMVSGGVGQPLLDACMLP